MRRVAALVAVAAIACRPPAPVVPAPFQRGWMGLVTDWTAARCAPRTASGAGGGADADADGLDDRCELALARAFAPELIVDPADCLWLPGARPARLAGGWLFAVGRAPGSRALRIAYLPAYARDCGGTGVLCGVRPGNCGAHAGDSELIVVDLRPVELDTPGRWWAHQLFLSAHCGGRSAGRCRWFGPPELRNLEWADRWPLGAPRVWVARGKHAHYPTRRDCDRGRWGEDSCDGNRVAIRFPIVSAAQNVGSRRHPLPPAGGCVAARDLPLGDAGLDPAAVECLWDPARAFRGWQADARGRGPTSYGRHLADFAGF